MASPFHVRADRVISDLKSMRAFYFSKNIHFTENVDAAKNGTVAEKVFLKSECKKPSAVTNFHRYLLSY